MIVLYALCIVLCDQYSLLISFTHTWLLLMAHHRKSITSLRASPSSKENKSSRRALNFFKNRQNQISVQSNGFSAPSMRQVFVLVLFVTVLLVHIRMLERVLKLSNCFHQCKNIFLSNESPCLRQWSLHQQENTLKDGQGPLWP